MTNARTASSTCWTGWPPPASPSAWPWPGRVSATEPVEFEAARQRLADHIVHWGYLPSRAAYINLVQQADLVISTADHEFFGVSILEAICAGAFPLLPARLSYPELVPDALHPACLYRRRRRTLRSRPHPPHPTPARAPVPARAHRHPL